MGPSPAGKKRLLTEINMVPFIDVVLVLLIIFMILSPFLAQSQIPVNLPFAVTHLPPDQTDPLKIQVTRQGDFYIGGGRVLRADVRRRLQRLLREDPQKPVLIEADKDVAFENVVVALDAAEQERATKVGVAIRTESP